ncbi:hypothetical protein [Bacillus manliponensis]|nr:hypothetical protein [Bacillus manliponensis]
MKKVVLSLMGLATIFTLTFGVHGSTENNKVASTLKTMADGNTGG